MNVINDENSIQSGGTLQLNVQPTFTDESTWYTYNSASFQARQWIEQAFDSGFLSLSEYQEKFRELSQAIHFGIDSAATRSDGIISSLRYLQSVGLIAGHWYFASVDCDFYVSEKWEWNFACCYRNAQMILSALFRLPECRKRLFGSLSSMPSVWKLQTLLESAWKVGFDPVGYSQVSQMIQSLRSPEERMNPSDEVTLFNSTVWLGATDLAALLGFCGVRCCLVESHPSNAAAHMRLMKHILAYFKTASNSDNQSQTFQLGNTLPLFFQQQGHSFIVAGIQVDESENPIALLTLDPNIPLSSVKGVIRAAEIVKNIDLASMRTADQARPSGHNLSYSAIRDFLLQSTDLANTIFSMRMEASAFKQPFYQLLQTDGLLQTELDLQDAMIPENITIVL